MEWKLITHKMIFFPITLILQRFTFLLHVNHENYVTDSMNLVLSLNLGEYMWIWGLKEKEVL